MDEVKKEEQSQTFATAEVAAVTADGLRLILPGEEEAGEKVYPCNAGVKFSVGDRVVCMADSGTMIVLFPLGAPGSRVPEGVPAGGTNDQILRKTNYGAAWGNETKELPTTGTVGQVLKKTSTGAAWGDEKTELPSGGSTGQVLKKTATGSQWANESGGLPTGGSNGYVLKKTSLGSEWSGSLGTSTYDRFGTIYAGNTYVTGLSASGSVSLGGSSSYLGFFGATGSTKKYLSATATVSDVITALKGYGLFS